MRPGFEPNLTHQHLFLSHCPWNLPEAPSDLVQCPGGCPYQPPLSALPAVHPKLQPLPAAQISSCPQLCTDCSLCPDHLPPPCSLGNFLALFTNCENVSFPCGVLNLAFYISYWTLTALPRYSSYQLPRSQRRLREAKQVAQGHTADASTSSPTPEPMLLTSEPQNPALRPPPQSCTHTPPSHSPFPAERHPTPVRISGISMCRKRLIIAFPHWGGAFVC